MIAWCKFEPDMRGEKLYSLELLSMIIIATYPVTHDGDKVQKVIKVHKARLIGTECLAHTIPKRIHLMK
jgi:hypothetical protein